MLGILLWNGEGAGIDIDKAVVSAKGGDVCMTAQKNVGHYFFSQNLRPVRIRVLFNIEGCAELLGKWRVSKDNFFLNTGGGIFL